MNHVLDSEGPIIASACFGGRDCTYDGDNNANPVVIELAKGGRVVFVCPEILGKLPTPRPGAERRGKRVVTRDGSDVTDEYNAGAEEGLKIAQESGATIAILKVRSPSCGKGEIYSGWFKKELVPGNGVFAELLIKNGSIDVLTEDEI